MKKKKMKEEDRFENIRFKRRKVSKEAKDIIDFKV